MSLARFLSKIAQLLNSSGQVKASGLESGAAVSNIGYTPVNKTGDSMSGALTISASALALDVTDTRTSTSTSTTIAKVLASSGADLGVYRAIQIGHPTLEHRATYRTFMGNTGWSIGMVNTNSANAELFVASNGQLIQNNLPAYTCRAWVNFNGGWGGAAVAIRASGNVSSITDNGLGDFTLNFTVAMPDANYAFNGNAEASSDSNTSHNWNMNVNLYGTRAGYLSTSSCRIKVTGGIPAGGLTDSEQIHCEIFR